MPILMVAGAGPPLVVVPLPLVVVVLLELFELQAAASSVSDNATPPTTAIRRILPGFLMKFLLWLDVKLTLLDRRESRGLTGKPGTGPSA
jgi:hypothetical protein